MGRSDDFSFSQSILVIRRVGGVVGRRLTIGELINSSPKTIDVPAERGEPMKRYFP